VVCGVTVYWARVVSRRNPVLSVSGVLACVSIVVSSFFCHLSVSLSCVPCLCFICGELYNPEC